MLIEYLRNCVFDSCDFTGCRFVGCLLHDSSFIRCKFDYAIFERTLVDLGGLLSSVPVHEKLKIRFARTLRMNFQQTGDAGSVNEAIELELRAKERYLWKAWASRESYNRRKYKGCSRMIALAKWAEFKLLDLLWGNGESISKLCRSLGILVVVVTLIDAWTSWRIWSIGGWLTTIRHSPQLALGTLSPTYYSKEYLAFLVFLRLIAMALVLSMIIKKSSRR